MKKSIKTFLTILILAVVYVTVTELSMTPKVYAEINIESITEVESSKSEPTPDTLLLSNDLLYSLGNNEIPTSESHFISSHFTKDIFKPPLFV